MKLIMSSVVVLVAALSVGIAAQSGDTMAKGEKMDKMATKDATHSGCIEAGSAPGTFTLTHLAADDHMVKDAMKTMTKESMSKGAMAPPTLSLTSTSVDLSKHLGHRVSVTGSHDKATSPFAVKSLKMVAATCS